MKRFTIWLSIAVLAIGLPIYAFADYAIKDGNNSAQTIFAFVCQTTKICPAHVVINSSGTEIGTSSNPVRFDPTGTTKQPATEADGDNATIGAKADAAYTGSGSASVIAILKGIYNAFIGPQPAGPNTIGNTVPAPTSSSSLALTKVTCGSAASSCVLKNAAGNFYGVYAECTSACWLMVFNATSAPADGATTAGTGSGNLVDCVDIPANGSRSISYPTFPVNLSVGATAVISSTACATKTASTVGFISGTVQ